ncbi:MAG: cytochrome c oxidase accessory protein CcoG [Flavobacteriia bacterium]|nr:cytochrome c oxidase accessory protein CcoG [Flavobacteriia bacterium]
MSEDKEDFRDRIATVNEDGKRVWIFPKKPKGRYFNYRKITSYSLLAFLFLLPHIKVHGDPFLLLNVIERKFIIFGYIFWPQDFYIFAIATILGIVFIILFTIIYGRIFCGWICPQTIFMEMIFRRIEYWIEGDYTHQKKLANQSWNAEKIRKRILKHSIFWIISFMIANTFLAYIISADELWRIQTDNMVKHYGGLIATAVFTTVFYFVFARLREQVCTTICPYGRLQGVLLDPNSMVVAYDYKRGEGRAKFKKGEDRKNIGKGDCIDCKLCVHVCPTGIDIRNGTQLECINCTACIDECDTIMEGVGQEKGLIRFVSENGIKNGTGFQWTKRVKAYTVLLFVLLGILATLLVTRQDFQATIFRQRGTSYIAENNGMIENIFEINLSNKTRNDFKIQLKLEDKIGSIKLVVKNLTLKKEAHLKDRFIVQYPFSAMENGKKNIIIIVLGNGKEIQRVKARFIGPML